MCFIFLHGLTQPRLHKNTFKEKASIMKIDMKEILDRMLNHEELTREDTKNILIGITRSEYPTEQITALLTGLQMRGITIDELLGFRDGILETGIAVPLDCDRYIDVVGTGGDRKNTFNISTTSCFVIAGAGYKYQNMAITLPQAPAEHQT